MAKPSINKSKPPFDIVIDLFFIACKNMVDNWDDRSMRTKVIDMRLKTDNDEAVYDQLGETFIDIGHPRAYFDTHFDFMGPGDAIAQKSAKNAMVIAVKAQRRAQAEYTNKRRCVEYELEERRKQATMSSLTTALPTGGRVLFDSAVAAVNPGDFVLVSEDLSSGKSSHGGRGWIKAVSGVGDATTATVEYLETENSGSLKLEPAIPLSRLTICPIPEIPRPKRARLSTDVFVPPDQSKTASEGARTPTIGLRERLMDGFSRNRKKGWRAKDLQVDDSPKPDFNAALTKDILELRGILAGIVEGNRYTDRNKDGKFKNRSTKNSPLTRSYLAFAWGTHRNQIRRLEVKDEEGKKESRGLTASQLSVIESLEAAKARFTAMRIFIDDHMARSRSEVEILAFDNLEDIKENWRADAKVAWLLLSESEREIWTMKAREKIERQPVIRDQIVVSLQKNPSKSLEKVAQDIGNWCSKAAISRWLQSKEDYDMYVERLLPLLTKEQMKKHLDFAVHLQNNWGHPRGKYLIIHYDEKWFWGYVGRATAKYCKSIGLDKVQHYAYHKQHLTKVMCVAATGYAFDGNPENGGDGLKLGFFRVQGARIAQRRVKKSRRTDEGRIVYDGPMVREKGEVYMVDCNVTGSDEGSSDVPKFALKSLFEEILFPQIAALVAEGGKYEGYTPVIQGDNAGPHQDEAFLRFCSEYCEAHRWLWEPQAPQMPHANNLDLAIFPAMSKRHSDLLREYGNTVAPAGAIWEAAASVWKSLDSATVARGHVLAYRIAQKVIDCKGANNFLGNGGLHAKVRADFVNTDTGVSKKILAMHM